MKPLPRILFPLAIAGFLLAGAAMVWGQAGETADGSGDPPTSDAAVTADDAVDAATPGGDAPGGDGGEEQAPSFSLMDPGQLAEIDSVTDVWDLELLHVSGQAVVLNQIVAALLLLIIGVALSWWIQRRVRLVVARRSPAREHTATFIATIVFLVLLITVVITTLAVLGIPVTAFAFLGGALAIGLGFGMQNILNNFVSGIILMSEGQFRIGDVVEVGEHLATVEQIGARSSRIKRFDGIDLIVPNSQIIENTVVNRTLSDDLIRFVLEVGIAYGSPTRRAEALLVEAAQSVDGVLEEPAPVAIFEAFGDNALVFELYIWCRMGRRTPFDIRIIRSDVRHKIDQLFREAEITIAFPQRDVHLDTLDEPLHVRIDKSDGDIPGGKTPKGGGALERGETDPSDAQQEG